MFASIKNFLHKVNTPVPEKGVVEAYDIWSDSYDRQPGNLMLDLDAEMFSRLTESIELKDKVIADVGCGTGRHWSALYAREPKLVIGFDVSAGMLKQLQLKYPDGVTHLITGNDLPMTGDDSVDCLVSTLTVAHIENIGEAICAWWRVLKTEGDLLITDFHPAILAKGGKRSFSHKGKTLVVKNYVHGLDELKKLLTSFGFTLIREEERVIDEQVRVYYEN